jgi:hypothetical protein
VCTVGGGLVATGSIPKLPSQPAHQSTRGKELSMSEGNKPATQFRLGNMTAKVWQNGRHYTTVLSKMYKDGGGEWKDTDQLNTGDLLNAAKCLHRAEEWVIREPEWAPRLRKSISDYLRNANEGAGKVRTPSVPFSGRG